ncbi:MAG TPA: penicillin-insensitive murein endopeptidase [Bdellovibrionales bacterium]|nr:penicillin-insensitive murein endopeptidase [Bdellovibrionales bacterium]
MGSRIRLILVMSLLSLLTACGDDPQGKTGSHTFGDQHGQNQTDPKTTDPAATPEEETERERQREERDQQQAQRLVKEGERDKEIQVYEIPEPVKKVLRAERPDLIIETSQKFQLLKHNLHISVKNSTFTLTGVLRIAGKQDENIELRCNFDKTPKVQGEETLTWECKDRDMFPTDIQVARQKRLQAVAVCHDPWFCKEVSLKLLVEVDGKLESKHYQTRGFSMRLGSSGDSEEDESGEESEDPGLRKVDPVQGRQEEDRGTREKLRPVSPIPGRQKPVEPPPAKKEDLKKEEPKPKKTDPAPREKVTREEPAEQQVPTEIPVPEARPKLTVEEFEKIAEDEDSNDTLQIEDQLVTSDARKDDEFSPKGVEPVPTEVGSNVPDQAQGYHQGTRQQRTRGSLRSAQRLADSGTGYLNVARKKYGADITIKLIRDAAARAQNSSNKIAITQISYQNGGRAKPSNSHQNGLDIDSAYPSKGENSNSSWSVCTGVQGKIKMIKGPNDAKVDRSGRHCAVDKGVNRDFDTARFWTFASTFVCAQNSPVIVLFMDPEIKKHMCRFAKQSFAAKLTNKESCEFKTLRAMRHEPGHYDHVHIRLKCPGNKGCRGKDSEVTLGRGTGC